MQLLCLIQNNLQYINFPTILGPFEQLHLPANHLHLLSYTFAPVNSADGRGRLFKFELCTSNLVV